jgi:hypothetical protein
MLTGEILKRGREAGVPEAQLQYFVTCVHSKTGYLDEEKALASCIKAYATDKEHPLQVEHEQTFMKSGTHAPQEEKTRSDIVETTPDPERSGETED